MWPVLLPRWIELPLSPTASSLSSTVWFIDPTQHSITINQMFMRPTSTLKPMVFGFLLTLLGPLAFTQQVIQFDEVLLSEIESFTPTEKKNQLILKMAYGTSSVSNPGLLKKLQGKKVEAIDYYFTDFPKGQTFESLHSARLTKLTALIPDLWNRKFFISWKAYRQTKCETAEEAKQLFHGFVVTYSEGDPLAFLSPTKRAILDTVKTKFACKAPTQQRTSPSSCKERELRLPIWKSMTRPSSPNLTYTSKKRKG